MAEINPILRTPPEQHNEVEIIKRRGLKAPPLEDRLGDPAIEDVIDELKEQTKPLGLYVQTLRDPETGKLLDDLTGTNKKQRLFMVRVTIPGGGVITPEVYLLYDRLADEYTKTPDRVPSLRPTTRQNIQFHYVPLDKIKPLIQGIAQSGFIPLNGCGDNTRNVIACPVSLYSNVYNANANAQKFGSFFRLDEEPFCQVFEIHPSNNPREHRLERFNYGPQKLNRKFKINFSAGEVDPETRKWVPDNCVEAKTGDIGIGPIYRDGKVEAYQIHVGGGQGEKHRLPTTSAMALPLGIFPEERLQESLDAIVALHQALGDRKDRHWARLKYTLYGLGEGDKEKGLKVFREMIKERIGPFDYPDSNYDFGEVQLHHGWMNQPSNGLLSYGLFLFGGRIINGPNGKIKDMLKHILENYDIKMMISPSQDPIITNIKPDEKEIFEKDLASFGYQHTYIEKDELKRNSVACVGLPTCPLAFTHSETYLPVLIKQLEEMGWGNFKTRLGISACDAQCSRPATKEYGLVGIGKNLYMFKLMADGREQGMPVVESDGNHFLERVHRNDVPTVLDTLFRFYFNNRLAGETVGAFHRRVGMDDIIEHLKTNPATEGLMAPAKKKVTPYMLRVYRKESNLHVE
jgi:sulfite reductase beta subunit-like hemoprotein